MVCNKNKNIKEIYSRYDSESFSMSTNWDVGESRFGDVGIGKTRSPIHNNRQLPLVSKPMMY